MSQPARSFQRRSRRARQPRHGRLVRRLWAALVLLLALSVDPRNVGGREVGTIPDDPFAAVTATGTNLAPFRKWQSALQRHAAEQREATREGCLAAAPTAPACLYAEWDRFIDGLRTKDRREQLRAVNQEVNRRPYVTDAANWGQEDYWETPAEFLARSGDCEDFAILKFLSLRRLGWTGETLRIAAVHDTRLNIGHAVVVVEDEGRTWILDNQMPDVVEAANAPHYQPVYSLTETTWRLHRTLEQSTASPGALPGPRGR